MIPRKSKETANEDENYREMQVWMTKQSSGITRKRGAAEIIARLSLPVSEAEVREADAWLAGTRPGTRANGSKRDASSDQPRCLARIVRESFVLAVTIGVHHLEKRML
jgi:hypothetical protein